MLKVTEDSCIISPKEVNQLIDLLFVWNNDGNFMNNRYILNPSSLKKVGSIILQ